MTKKNNQQEDDTNYSFLLKCMAALSAAAIATAGIIAAVSLKSAAVATTAIAAKTLLASAFIFAPVLPIALFAIGLMLVVPFLFGCNNNTYTTVRTTTPGYNGIYSFYPPSSVYNGFSYSDNGASTVYASSNHSHGHTTSGTVHGHSDSHMHGHSGSHVHGHGDSHVHKHF